MILKINEEALRFPVARLNDAKLKDDLVDEIVRSIDGANDAYDLMEMLLDGMMRFVDEWRRLRTLPVPENVFKGGGV
ncbi:hypothetical protein L2E82_00410 [Cichorium intybus]|uniref:Uncharacterized protein n=1 Tax=Cichorium intybus TaxID=13427 RepID=A0ACB9GXW4_CICIN|nr:hypothetical protein L2E82_00410 [Cichorium intybus]